MKTYEKLPIKSELQKSVSWNDIEEIEIDVQYYKITETQEIVKENITTKENFIKIIENLEIEKQNAIIDFDNKIQENKEILEQLNKF